jgi:hypothetical protein
VADIFCRILTKFVIERFEKKWPKQNYMEIRQVKIALTHGDKQTDMTKLIGHFRYNANQCNKIKRVITVLHENKCVYKYTVTYYRLQYSNIYPTRCKITQFILSGNCSTCFGWYHHPSSGAETTVSIASGICQTVTVVEEPQISNNRLGFPKLFRKKIYIFLNIVSCF